jgi:hypothetical protein
MAKRRIILGILAVLIVLLSFVLHLPGSPRFDHIGTDSAFYAYGAQEILSGRLLYRDFFDNHLHGVFYIDALAMLIGGQTSWSIWWLGVVWIAVSSLAFLLTMAKLTDILSAFLGTIFFIFTLMYPAYYQGGNLTEVYALLPQVLGIAASAAYFYSRKDRWVAVLGFLFAVTFLFKQTNVAIQLAALALILYADIRAGKRRRALLHLMIFIIVVVILFGGIILYWAANGAFDDLWHAAIVANLFYAGQVLSIVSVYGLIRMLVIVQPLAAVFAIALAGSAVFILRNRSWLIQMPSQGGSELAESGESKANALNEGWRQWVFAIIVLAIPIDVIFLVIAGWNLGHYFLTPLPVLAAAGTYLFSQVRNALANWRRAGKEMWWIVSMVMLAFLMAAWGIEVLVKEAPRREHLASLTMPLRGENKVDELHEFVLENTVPTESVLVWGFHPDINFLTQRRAPSRYLYHPFLFYPSSTEESRFEEFLKALNNDPPGLIIAQEKSASNVPFFGLEGEALCPGCNPEARYGMEQLKAYVESQYSLIETQGTWLIYKRKP